MNLLTLFRRPAFLLGCAVGAVAFAPSASAVPILGGHVIVASDGNVVAKFLGHTAGFTNLLYLSSPATYPALIFNNQTATVGDTVDLGFFTSGTELIFKIHVVDTGDDFYTGPASRNPDTLAHAVVDDAYSLTETYVGFEDLFGGGDGDYDDLKFSFTNVRGSATVPDASMTFGLLLAGLSMMVGIRRFACRV